MRLPPAAKMEGFEMVTEGILTLGKGGRNPGKLQQ